MTNGITIAKADIKVLRKYVDDHIISVQKHETEDLLIWNYTQKCQYDFAWDDYTRICRGLITDLQGNIIARPFPKFFNMSEHHGDDCKLPPINWKQDFTVTEKLDGSLGILYRTEEGYKIATRGSFTSDQAIKGTEMLKKYNLNDVPETLLFEIIYPENRIVVDYGEREELVLLDCVDKYTGKSVSRDELETIATKIGCTIANEYHVTEEQLKDFQKHFDKPNDEGVVVRFEDGTRIKIKLEEYVRLHRLITGTNARFIWDILRTGGDMEELIDRVPDEYFEWVKKTEKEIRDNYQQIQENAMSYFLKRDENWTRKEFAEYARSTKYPALLFCMLDEKDYTDKIWKMIKPEHSVPFKDEI